MGGPNYPTDRVGEQKITDPFPANSLIARKTSNESSRNEVIARQTFGMFGREVGEGERKRTQTVETDNPALVVDGDINTRHITFFVLPGTKTEPIIERVDAAPESRAVMLAERFDRSDHARSAEETSMTLQSLDKT